MQCHIDLRLRYNLANHGQIKIWYAKHLFGEQIRCWSNIMLVFIIQILSVFVVLRYENMFFGCLPIFYILTEILNSALPSCCSSCDVSRSSDALPTMFRSDIDFVRSIAYGSCCFDANGLTQNCVRFLLCVAYGSSCWRCPQNKA